MKKIYKFSTYYVSGVMNFKYMCSVCMWSDQCEFMVFLVFNL
jgi:hypothetical protein